MKAIPDRLIPVTVRLRHRYCAVSDRDKDIYNNLTAVERASRIINLNKTCYNV